MRRLTEREERETRLRAMTSSGLDDLVASVKAKEEAFHLPGPFESENLGLRAPL
jgi:hypothetical protein